MPLLGGHGRGSTWQAPGGTRLHITGSIFLKAQQQNLPLNTQTGTGFFLQETGSEIRRKTRGKNGHFPGKQTCENIVTAQAHFLSLRPKPEKKAESLGLTTAWEIKAYL